MESDAFLEMNIAIKPIEQQVLCTQIPARRIFISFSVSGAEVKPQKHIKFFS
jgi:hypothetical protein